MSWVEYEVMSGNRKAALNNIKEIGYGYAIIGGAGQLSFMRKPGGLLSFLLYNLSITGRVVFP
ncbi:hypothetical protein [Cytobacillus firmus]|uniref:hypothetical protein n=1 Tax=Cytobacillus firmus TaxID=1399 RepID=UPI0018CD0C0A|nr:hypothetical protein [Cytobacillus firmus]MBG9588416.1 hypothetical protein [Cytobacillus firmus]